jgi:phage terminase Nu1 subunit (DNA packaging protein)
METKHTKKVTLVSFRIPMKKQKTPTTNTPSGMVKLPKLSNEPTPETPPASSFEFEVTLDELAGLLELGTRRVAELRTSGILTPAGRGRFDGAKSVRGYIQHLRQELATKAGSSERTTLLQERTLKVKADRELAELRLERERGEVVAVATVREAGVKIGAVLSSRLTMLANDAASSLAGLNERELHKQLAGRVDSVLRAIREDMAKVV